MAEHRPLPTPPSSLFPFTFWNEAESVYTCEECGAWAPEVDEPEGHNRTCKYASRTWADAAARAAKRDLPEGKSVLFVPVRGGVVVFAADGELADSLRDWMTPKAVAAYVEDVRKAARGE